MAHLVSMLEVYVMDVVLVRRVVAGWLAGCVAVVVLALAGAALAGVVLRLDRVHRWSVFGVEVMSAGPEGNATVVGFGPGLWLLAAVCGVLNVALALWRARRAG